MTVKTVEEQQNQQLDERLKILEITMKRSQYRQDALIEILHKAQESFGYLELEVLEHIAQGLKLPLSQVYGVATFYHHFSLKPKGKHRCVVCTGTVCYVKGSNKILAALEQELGIKLGETTNNNQISLLSARCLGACGIAPSAAFDNQVEGKITPKIALDKVKTWQKEA